MLNVERIGTRIVLGTIAVTLSACAHGGNHLQTRSRLAEGMAVMNRCSTSEVLLVENQTGYPVQVTATDGGVSPSIGSATEIGTVRSGAVDTLVFGAKLHRKLTFNVERPAFPNGQKPPITGLHAECVPRT
jgi:hypothetical protein